MFGTDSAIECPSKYIAFCDDAENAGHSDSSGPFGSPFLAKFVQYELIRRAGPKLPPLSEIAPWKSPFAAGEAQSMLTAMPPADSLLHQVGSVVGRDARHAARKCTAMDPDHDWQLVTGPFCWRPNLEIEAIFAERRRRAEPASEACILHASSREGGGLFHDGPRFHGLGRSPPKAANR